MTGRIALLRGINVGRARRVPMAELRALCEGLGWTDVRTLLNSGNVVFRSSEASDAEAASALESALAERFGFDVPVVVVDGGDLRTIMDENPLVARHDDGSRLLVAFVRAPSALRAAEGLVDQEWAPEEIAIGSRAAYLWCADGVHRSKLAQAFARATGDAVTSRNWKTVQKLRDRVEG